jgi:hypothetical protein
MNNRYTPVQQTELARSEIRSNSIAVDSDRQMKMPLAASGSFGISLTFQRCVRLIKFWDLCSEIPSKPGSRIIECLRFNQTNDERMTPRPDVMAQQAPLSDETLGFCTGNCRLSPSRLRQEGQRRGKQVRCLCKTMINSIAITSQSLWLGFLMI